MCGIAGIFDLRDARPVDARCLAAMTKTLVHRGPDGEGFFHEPGCGLGHRRLAIIDLQGGAQPLFNEDESVVVVYNGEIYNFRELRDQLETRGHRFKTACDTEVIVHAWEEWREDCVQHFWGMFAFAVLDRKTKTLFLARDRIGIKPLYYTVLPNGQLLFASELKALLVHPGVLRKLSAPAIEDYFAFGYVPDPKTIYEGIHKLSPGHVLVCQRAASEPRQQRYWTLEPADDTGRFEDDVVSEELLERLQEAVRLRLVADVPLGAFLSGGVDSSTVVATMAGLSEEPVNTCSIGFTDQRYDESSYAEKIAHRFATKHFTETVDSFPTGAVDRLAQIYDEPFADSSAILTFQVCAIARKRVAVALSGDGGDEVFWGYGRYRWHADEERLRAKIPSFLRGDVARRLADTCPYRDSWTLIKAAKQTMQAVARSPAEAYLHTLSLVKESERRALFSPSLVQDLQGYRAFEVFDHHYRAAPSDHPVGKVQWADLMTYLPGDILTKVDRASMAHSLEVRVPLLDHHLVAWAHTLPPDKKLRNGEGKFILKKAMESSLPSDLLYRNKMGFAVPLDEWFRGPLAKRAQEVFSTGPLRDCDLFRPDALLGALDSHRKGRRNFGSLLWAFLMFDAFLRKVHTAPSNTDSTCELNGHKESEATVVAP